MCCGTPLLALLGGIGAASVLAALWIPALAVIALAAAVAGYVLYHKRRAAASCRPDGRPVALGLPGIGGGHGDDRDTRTPARRESDPFL